MPNILWFNWSDITNPETGDAETLFHEKVSFNGGGKYNGQEFIWNSTVAPTALRFVNSSLYGKGYENDMVAGFFRKGNHFNLNDDRTELSLQGRTHG
jgi:hypothetical protein